jgi:hypothetical protein
MEEKEHSTEPKEAEQQPKQKYQPKTTEPKSWNKVVSGGQNKSSQPQPDKMMGMAGQGQQQFGTNSTQQMKAAPQPPNSNEQQSKGKKWTRKNYTSFSYLIALYF